MRAVSNAVEHYVRGKAGRLPPMEDLTKLEADLRPYLENAGKGLGVPLLARPETHEPYVFNLALSAKLRSEYPHPESIILFYESKDNAGGRLVAFLDGHHIWAAPDQWKQIQKDGGLPMKN